MSVPKSKRKESQFEVFHHWTEVRKKITDLLLMDFGYSFEKFYKKLERRYGGKSFEELIERIHFLLKSCYKIQSSNICYLVHHKTYAKGHLIKCLLLCVLFF